MKNKTKRILFCMLAVLFVVAFFGAVVLSCLKRDKEPLTVHAASSTLNVSSASPYVEPKFSLSSSLGVQNYSADVTLADIPSYFPPLLSLRVRSLEASSVSFSLSWSVQVRNGGVGWNTIESGDISFSSSNSVRYITFEMVEYTALRLVLSYVRAGSQPALYYNVRVYCTLEDLFDAGFASGYQDGQKEVNKEAYDEGYSAGYDTGHQDGLSVGETSGYNKGFSAGKEQGITEGYNSGYEVGKVDGYELGYADGIDTGFASNSSVITYFLAPVATFMEMKLFGVVSLNAVFSVVLFVFIATIFIKLFAGG